MSNSHSNTPVITLITGCSRGLGLEFATQLLACSPNNFVICAARNPSAADELMALVEKNEGRVECVQMDVGDADSVTRGVAEVKKVLERNSWKGIDVLINNAGILSGGFEPILNATIKQVHDDLQTNLLGPICVTQAVLPLLELGHKKTIINISSILGSMGAKFEGIAPSKVASYSISKAALNMFTVKLAHQLEEVRTILHSPPPMDPTDICRPGEEQGRDIVFSVHPGYVKTDMSGGADGPAEITKEESVSRILGMLKKKTQKDTGKFFDNDGSELPW